MSQPPVSDERRDPFLGRAIPSDVYPSVSYRLERLLGEGGTARAYYAIRVSPEGESSVVVKIILPQVVRDGGDTARLVIQKEAVALGRLNERVPPSPYVVRFVDTGSVPFSLGFQTLSLPWLALEYVNGGVEGTALDERIVWTVKRTGYAFDPERAARAVDALTRGLSEIHAEGIVHRDITPGNVLCCGGGDTEMFKIADFGIARPIGLQATFGNVAIGTPGYVAPEQTLAKNAPVGPASDVFALAAVIYCLLTGEHYFRARTTIDAYQEVMNPHRRSVLDAKSLCPELRDQPAAVQGIDHAIARATLPDPAARPQSAALLADSLRPWLSDQPRSVRLNDRWLKSVVGLRPSPSRIERIWFVRHPPGEDRLVLGATWNASGHCLAATTAGLQYFNGTDWSPGYLPDALAGRRVCAVQRLRPTTWLVSATGARLVELAREGTTVLTDGPDPSLEFDAISGDLDDLAVMIANGPNRPPMLCTYLGRRWLKPLPVPEVSSLSGLGRIGEERWLVTGRSVQGHAWAAIYRPLDHEWEPLEIPNARALLACHSRRGRNVAIAVGGEGVVFRMEDGRSALAVVPGQPDLSTVTLDAAGQPWMASSGSLWTQHANGSFECVWHDPRWMSPFVCLHAEMGQLLALTVDGAVLECRENAIGPSRAA